MGDIHMIQVEHFTIPLTLQMQMSARRINMELDMERLFLPWTWAQLEA